MKKHNFIIDMLRFVAALMVVLFHLNQAIAPIDNWYRNIVKYGWLGVPVFFVISGYCIILSAYNSRGLQDFLSRRFFRIFPPYWVSLIVVLFAACFQKIYIGTNAVHFLPHSLRGWLATLTLTTSPITDVHTVNWIYWTLSCELLFYLTVCILLLFNKKIVIYLLIIISLMAAIFPVPNIGILFFLEQWPAFGLGISIYYFLTSSNKLSYVCFGVLFILNVIGLFNKFNHQTSYIEFTLVTTILIFVSNYIKSSKNIVSTLGQHSYSVYLIHVPVGVFMLGLFESSFIKEHPVLNCIYDLAVYIVISTIAWLIYIWVEKPSIVYGKNISKANFHDNPKKTAVD